MRKIFWFLVPLIGMGIATARAQQADAPTGQVESTTTSPTSPSAPSQTLPPLSGMQVLAPTFGGTSESYVVPALACQEFATTNPTGLNRNAGLFSQSSCGGTLTLQKVNSHSQLNLDFNGGGFYYNRPFEATIKQDIKQYGTIEGLTVSERVTGRRWNWMLGDQGTYLPDGSLGGAFAGLSSFAGGMGGGSLASAPALNSGFSPNQSIYGGLGRRASDLAFTEFSYTAGPRTTLTATGMFGTQQFLTPGYIDDRYWIVMTGYNRTFGRGSEVALDYQEMHFNFGASQPIFLTRGASILYGRAISPKFSVELSVAPMDRVISIHQADSTTNLFLGTYDTLLYHGLRWDGALTFDRTMAGGAGYLAGSEMSMVSASLGRQVSRRVHGSLDASYANNRGLAVSSSGALRPTYKYVQVGANLTHELGRNISMYLNYYVQRQVSNTSLCEGAICSTSYFRQVGGIGINWHTQPIKIH